jgi:hypothetical protein
MLAGALWSATIVASLLPASWNRMIEWLRLLEGVRHGA